MNGKFFKHKNTEIRRVGVEFQKINIADILLKNNMDNKK